mgnify:CR=1 FL=1
MSAEYDIARQIKCVQRELALRKRVYPRFVAGEKITQEVADEEIAVMTAVLATLKSLDNLVV